MFGDSHKPWMMQLDEYCWDNRKSLTTIEKVEMSHSKWISWGGLKWCLSEKFQQQLKREGVQDHERDNPKPRQYSKMNFVHNNMVDDKARRIFYNCLNDIGEPSLLYYKSRRKVDEE
ncbi:spore protein H [Paenibacillus radicibacter]|uniref:spore protein H n=1 Tax=Paenibacillus radicibacter TaxID=2972488 RepID=UPI002158DA07|nr:spore protein H [Paenibacillus radicibacter]